MLRITLGTAQLGSFYGVANMHGQPSLQTAYEILEAACQEGITSFDTAPAYGSSEEILGSFFGSRRQFSPVFITKLDSVFRQAQDNLHAKEVKERLKKSLLASAARLQIERIPVCLMHDPGYMIAAEGTITEALCELKQDGLVEAIGVSVYSPEEVRTFLELDVFDAIQVPFNLFDQRLDREGLLQDLSQKCSAVFARSIFLQGLFFLNPDALPNSVICAAPYLKSLILLATDLGLTIAELAVSYVRDVQEITSFVIGVETPDQLRQNVKMWSCRNLSPEERRQVNEVFKYIPEQVFNPTYWKEQ